MIDFDAVKRDVIGRWDGIYQALGIEVGDGKHTACPVCGGKDRFRCDNKEGKGTWYCSQCDPHSGDGWALVQKILNIDFKEAMEQIGGILGSVEKKPLPKEMEGSREILNKVFGASAPAKDGDYVSRYLKSRGLTALPPALRCSSACWCSETKRP